MNKARLDKDGREIPDSTSRSMPAGFQRPPTLAEQVRRLVYNEEHQRSLDQAGFETFEESEDFDVDDEADPHSPFEEFFDPDLGRSVTLHELNQNREVYKRRFLEAQKAMLAENERQDRIRTHREENIKNWVRRRFFKKDDKSGGGQSPPNAS